MATSIVEINIKRAGEGRRGFDPHAFRWETTTYEREEDDGQWVQAELVWKRDLRDELDDMDSPAAQAKMAAVLRRFLDELRWPVDELLAASQAGSSLHLVFRFAAAELYALPWETVRVDGTALALLPGIHVRYTMPGESPPPPRDHEQGRVMLAAAGRVPTFDHVEAIARAFESQGRKRPKGLRDPSLAGLTQGLNQSDEPLTVLHLLAHGQQLPDGAVGVALDEPIDGRALAEVLQPHRDTLRLVVLCVCRSADPGKVAGHLGSLAQEVHAAGVESVIAARQPLRVDASILLAQSLYRELVSARPPQSLERSLARARADLVAAGFADDATALQLYSHCKATDTRPLVFRPYRGLEPFDACHRSYFFGREAQLVELRDELLALIDNGHPRLHVVEGTSGSGKSSLARCGLVSELEATGEWVCQTMVPGNDPDDALERALDSLEGTAAGRRQLLVVDQLEEIFTNPQTEADTRDRFVRKLWALASEPMGLLSIVCTMRTDFRGRCGEVLLEEHQMESGALSRLYLDRLFVDGRHQVYVPRMSATCLVEAIARPAAAAGLTLEPGIPERILADVGHSPGALPLVQFALSAMWEKREGRALTQAAYEALGGATGALEHQAEALVSRWSAGELSVARHLLVRLVSLDGGSNRDVRRRPLLHRLRPHDAEQAAIFDHVVSDLVDARLVVRSRSTAGGAQLEIAHEALIRRWSRLLRWLEEDHEMLMAMRQLERWVEEFETGHQELLRGSQLGFARRVRQQFGPEAMSERTRAFLRDSERAQRKRRRAARTVRVAGVGGLLALTAMLTALSLSSMANRKKAAATKKTLHQTRILAKLLTERALPPAQLAATLREPAMEGSEFRLTSVAYDALQNGGFEPTRFVPPAGERVVGWDCGPGTTPAPHTLPEEDRLCGTVRTGTRFITQDSKKKVHIRTAMADAAVSLEAELGPVLHASFSPEGRRLLTLEESGSVTIWAADSGRRIHSLPTAAPGSPTALFSPSGTTVLTASSAGPTQVWSTASGERVATLPSDANYTRSAAYLPSEKLVALSGQHHAVELWSTETWEPTTHNLDCNTPCDDSVCHAHETTSSVSLSRDGLRIAAAHHGAAHVWSTETEDILFTVPTGLDHVDFVLLSPDGTHVAVGYDGHSLGVWNVDSDSQVPVSQFSRSDRQRSRDARHTNNAAFLPDGRTIAVAYDDGTARTWTWTGIEPEVELKAHSAPILATAFVGERLVTVADDGSSARWSMTGELLEHLVPQTETELLVAAVSPRGGRVVATQPDGTILFWSTKGDLPRSHPPQGPGAVDTNLSFSLNGDRVISSGPTSSPRVWSADGLGDPVLLPVDPAEVLLSARLSSDGQKAVTVTRTGGVQLWDARHGTRLHTLDLAPGDLGASPDEELTLPASDAVFSEDGLEVIVTVFGRSNSETGNTVRVFSSTTGRLASVLRGHEGHVYAARHYGHNGERRVVTASWDRSARLWSLDKSDGPSDRTLVSGVHGVLDAHFAPDGQHIVTVDLAGPARLWDATNGHHVLELAGPTGWVKDAAISPTSSHIVTTDFEGAAQLWPVADKALQDLLWSYSPVCPRARQQRDLLRISWTEAKQRRTDCLDRVAELRDSGVYAWLGPFQHSLPRSGSGSGSAQQ